MRQKPLAKTEFRYGYVQGLFSKADARDRPTGLPTPEAPQQIVDEQPFYRVARTV